MTAIAEAPLRQGQRVRVTIPASIVGHPLLKAAPAAEFEGTIKYVVGAKVFVAHPAGGVWLPNGIARITPINGVAAPAAPKWPERPAGKLTASVVKDRIRIGAIGGSTFPFKDQLAAIPGADWKKAPVKAWEYPASPTAARNLVAAFPDLQFDQAFGGLLAEAGKIDEAQSFKRADNLPEIPCTRTAAWKHQARGFWFIANLWGGLPDAR